MKKVFLSALACGSLLTSCVEPPPPIQERPVGKISLASYDAELINSKVFIYQTDDQLQPVGDPVFEGMTDELGRNPEFDVTLSDGFLLFKAGGEGFYIEESSGKKVFLNPDDYLSSIWYYKAGDNLDVTISGFTSIGTAYAQCLVKRYGDNASNAMLAMTGTVSAMYDIPIFREIPKNPSIPRSAGLINDASVTYGHWAAGISQLMSDIAIDNGFEPHSDNYRSFDYYNFAVRDIAEDKNCSLDGVIQKNGAELNLGVGSYVFTTDTYRVDHARATLTFIKSDRNLTAVTAQDFLYNATALSDVEDVRLFSGVSPTPLDDEGPEIQLQYPEGQYFAGLMEYKVKATDYTEVKKIEMYIDDIKIGTEMGNDVTFRAVNTASYADGEYEIKIIAEDSQFQKTEVLHAVNFHNGSPIVSLESNPRSGEFEYEMVLSIESPIGLASVTINGADKAFESDGSVTASLYLDLGVNTVTVVAIDSLGNETVELVELYVDRVAPTMSVFTPNGSYLVDYSGSANINHTYESALKLDGSANDPFYLDDSIVALGGMRLTSTKLANAKYIFLHFSVTDDLGGQDLKVITPSNEITVSYEYYHDEAIVRERTDLLSYSGTGGSFILPITSEYLGDDWFLFGDTEPHRITVYLKDNAGNEGQFYFEFEGRYFVDPSPIAAKVSTSRYASRGLANFPTTGTVEDFLTYTYKNTNSFPVTLGVKELGKTIVDHEFYNGVKEDQIVKTTTSRVEAKCKAHGDIAEGAWKVASEIYYYSFVWHGTGPLPSKLNPPAIDSTSSSSIITHNSDSLPLGSSTTTNYWTANPLSSTGRSSHYYSGSAGRLTPVYSNGLIMSSGGSTCPISQTFNYLGNKQYYEVLVDDVPNNSEVRRITDISYSQAIGYPKSTVTTESASSETIEYFVSAMVESIPQETADTYTVNPGDVIELTVALKFPEVALKGADCAWDYVSKKCDKNVELTTIIDNVLTLTPVFDLGTPSGSDWVHQAPDLSSMLD